MGRLVLGCSIVRSKPAILENEYLLRRFHGLLFNCLKKKWLNTRFCFLYFLLFNGLLLLLGWCLQITRVFIVAGNLDVIILEHLLFVFIVLIFYGLFVTDSLIHHRWHILVGDAGYRAWFQGLGRLILGILVIFWSFLIWFFVIRLLLFLLLFLFKFFLFKFYFFFGFG